MWRLAAAADSHPAGGIPGPTPCSTFTRFTIGRIMLSLKTDLSSPLLMLSTRLDGRWATFPRMFRWCGAQVRCLRWTALDAPWYRGELTGVFSCWRSPASNDTLPALLAEVRLLRQALERGAAAVTSTPGNTFAGTEQSPPDGNQGPRTRARGFAEAVASIELLRSQGTGDEPSEARTAGE